MIEVKKKMTKKSLTITIIAAILVLLTIVTGIVLDTYMKIDSGEQDDSSAKEPPEIIEGEALYNKYTPLMYPATKSANIQSFTVNGEGGYFSAKRPDKSSGIFYYYYKDTDGVEQVYLPSICGESGFDYLSLYAISDDGYNTPKISYVLSALSIAEFDSRIEIKPDDKGQYGAALAVYGLDHNHRETISVTYLEKRMVETEDKDGNKVNEERDVEVTKTIHIGNRLVTGIGYYVQIEGRPEYVYVSSTAENLTYALEGFTEFITPRVIMKGGEGDTTAEPLLTSGYKQWKNTVHNGKDQWGNPITEFVAAGSNIVFTADSMISVYKKSDDTDLINTDGYIHSGYKTFQVDLEDIAKTAAFRRFVNTVTGKAVGSYENEEILATIVRDTNYVTLNDGVSEKYTYTIYEIESVITDNAEFTSGAVGNNNLIKVTYDYLLDGEEPKEEGEILPFGEPCHAVIDLTDERIPADIRATLRSSDVGRLSKNLSFDITYTPENSNTRTVEYFVKDINMINEIQENGGVLATDKITEKSVVTFNYQMISDGEVVDEGIETIPLGEITDKSTEFLQNIKSKLIGKEIKDDVNLKIYDTSIYYQLFMNFETYSIKSIDFYVVRELVSAYKFVNANNRDTFYGESIHENDLPADHPYKAYPVDWQSCDYVAKVLGGITAGSSSTVFEGLWGDEVVAVGLTPENMKEYGLYAYTIYFEIPRGVMTVGDDYEWLDTTGFTLYISERDSEGKRYVGSDMYNIVVRMDADVLYWIEEDFVDFWARRDIVMVDHTNLDKVTVNLNFSDLKGNYLFDLEHPTMWITADGKLHAADPGDVDKEIYNALQVYASVSGDYSQSVLSQAAEKHGQKVWLANIYNYAAGIYSGTGLSAGYDTLGDASFKSFLSVLYSTGYMGTLTAEESAAARENAPVMTLSFVVENSSAFEYSYDFFYTDDGRVAVSLYRYDPITGERRGERCDFYITNFALKKIVGTLEDLINGTKINVDAGYGEY